MNVMTKPVAPEAKARAYPLNCWWVAASATEVTRKPMERWLLERPVVLYRTEAGEPVALDNRCVHRWAPLSAGYLEGDTIVCAYHGARYSADERCIAYPTQSMVPSAARVRSYAVVERGPFIWIWMGDEARRTAAELPPDFPWASAPDWTVILGGFMLEADYRLLHENVLDLTHFNYLHKDSFKITDRQPPTYRIEGDKVFFNNAFDVSKMDVETRAVLGMGDPFALKQEEEGAFLSPAHHLVTSITTRSPNPHFPERVTHHVNHLLTRRAIPGRITGGCSARILHYPPNSQPA